ncbi:MAG TPA: hypothetical protein VFQ20_01865 [Burkholderiaceae bacterium]|nr:hypothetical protein [Burkholderiaceae bacterium]
MTLWRRVAAPICLSLVAPAAHAAAYLPGAEPDPPTGDAPAASASATEPLRASGGNGIQWRFAPWRWGGTLALDARWLKLEDSSTTRQGALFVDIDGSTYLWQPWFVQLRLGGGFVVSRDTSDGADAHRRSGGDAVTARAQLAVFPASRFPFEMRAEVSDSRTNGEATLGQDRRTHRFALSQSWRPETGSDQVQVHVDASHLFGPEGRDTLVVVDGSAQLQRGPHRFEFGVNRADNHRGDGSDASLLTTLTARHGYHPRTELDVDSLASWNRARLHAGGLDPDEGLDSEVRQLSTLVTWRPRAGELPIALPSSTLVVGSARWVAQRLSGGGELSASAFNATLGASADLGPDWRASLSGSVSQFDLGADREPVRSATLAGSATWAPRAVAWGAPGTWRWSPSATLSASLTRASGTTEGAGDRHTVGTQLTHSLSRDWLRSAGDAFSVSLSQSGALQTESDAGVQTRTRALAHSIGLVWQDASDGSRQQFASLSASDSRSFGDDAASFQLVNLQWSRRTQLSRMASWSGNVTLQLTRSEAQDRRPSASSNAPAPAAGWQRFATGNLSYEQQRFWGVPRLRLTLLAGLSTQQIERRSAGEIDAPLERVSRSLEARLDYQIGRLDARVAARAARVDDRSVASLIARVQRRF